MPGRRTPILALLAMVFTAPAFAAPVPKVAPDTPIAKARVALNKSITARAEAKSLTETIELFKELTKADITLDTGSIQMMGIDPNQPIVNFDVKDAKLKDGLKAALAPLNLRFGITGTGILVSTEEGIIARQLRHRVTVEADGKPLGEVLKSLVEESGANVVIDPRAKKLTEEKVTLTLEDVPLETAVRLTAEVAGAGVIRMSNVLFVTTEARAEKLRPDADRPVGPVQANPLMFDGGGIGIAPGGGVFPVPQPGINPPPVPVQPPPPPALPPKEEKKD